MTLYTDDRRRLAKNPESEQEPRYIVPLDITTRTEAANATARTRTSSDIINYGYKGCRFILNVTAVDEAGAWFRIQGKDAVTGNYFDVTSATSTLVSAVGRTELVFYPGITEVEHHARSHPIPSQLRVLSVQDAAAGSATASMTDSSSIAYRVTCEFIP